MEYDVGRDHIMEALGGHGKSLKLPITGIRRYKVAQKKIQKTQK